MKSPSKDSVSCPCCSAIPYNQCCGPFLDGLQFPSTPEALMRSRFTAFALKNIDYVKNSMKGKALQKADFDQTAAWMEQTDWQQLEIVSTRKLSPTQGVVHFKATYCYHDQVHTLEEISEFRKINQRWFYTQGKQKHSSPDACKQKIGRNTICPCGSGKKFKHCCHTAT